jgi:hypothetical protein
MTVGTITVPTAGYCSTHRLKWQLDPTALLNNSRRLLLKFLDLAFIFGKLEKIYFSKTGYPILHSVQCRGGAATRASQAAALVVAQ